MKKKLKKNNNIIFKLKKSANKPQLGGNYEEVWKEICGSF
jgi:hypothetical protein